MHNNVSNTQQINQFEQKIEINYQNIFLYFVGKKVLKLLVMTYCVCTNVKTKLFVVV